MKLICDGLELSDAVLKVIKGTSNKTTNPILEGIKLTAEDDYLMLSATDLEISIEKKIKADIKIEGETVVPGRFFNEYIKKLTNEQIELTLSENNQLTIKYTDSIGVIQCLNSAEFPNIKNLDSAEHFDVSSRDLKAIINKTIFCVATEDSRPILKGVLIEFNEKNLKSIALDGYRLAICKKPIKNVTAKSSVIVPSRSLAEISKILEDNDEDITVYIQKNNLMVDINKTKIITRLLDGDFINYSQIIPSTFTTTVIVNKNQLEDALDRATLLSKIDKNNIVKFEISDKVLKLSSKSDIGQIEEKITIALNGKDLTIAFNARYFIEALRTTNDEFVKLNLTTTAAPCIITNNDTDEYLYLILPVRPI